MFVTYVYKRGVVEHYPPKERYEYERIRDLSKQRSIRKFPPIATCGDEAYRRIKQHGQVSVHFKYVMSVFICFVCIRCVIIYILSY